MYTPWSEWDEIKLIGKISSSNVGFWTLAVIGI